MVYKHGGEKLEIDYSKFQQGFSSGVKAKIRMMGKLASQTSMAKMVPTATDEGAGAAECVTRLAGWKQLFGSDEWHERREPEVRRGEDAHLQPRAVSANSMPAVLTLINCKMICMHLVLYKVSNIGGVQSIHLPNRTGPSRGLSVRPSLYPSPSLQFLGHAAGDKPSLDTWPRVRDLLPRLVLDSPFRRMRAHPLLVLVALQRGVANAALRVCGFGIMGPEEGATFTLSCGGTRHHGRAVVPRDRRPVA